MKKVKNAFALAIILVACYSCNKKEEKSDPSPSPSKEEVYDTPIPLKVGNYWVYDYYDYAVRDSVVTEKYNGRQKLKNKSKKKI